MASIPKVIKSRLKKVYTIFKLLLSYFDDFKSYLSYSNMFDTSNTRDKLLTSIIRQCHIIEKGLTMPNLRLGFGRERLIALIKDCLRYIQQYGMDSKQISHTVGVIAEYKQLHDNNSFELDEILLAKINQLISGNNILPTHQKTTNNDDYFQDSKSDFESFSNSRRSIRNFGKETIPLETLDKAIALAQNTPSSCNRQPSRVYVVDNPEMKEKVLANQSGNRGFGFLADKVLVLTSDLAGFRAPRERNCLYVDGGMYAMNLLYALHFYEIAACSLNASVDKKTEHTLKQLLNIPASEKFILIIVCGKLDGEFGVATSLRNDFELIRKIY